MLASLCLSSVSLAADSPEKFLEGLNGEYRGRGEAVIEISNRQERVSCKLENAFNSEQQKSLLVILRVVLIQLSKSSTMQQVVIKILVL